jgi:hypothetical protein
MFYPAPHDSKDALSKFLGFIGMAFSIALAVFLILPPAGAMTGSLKWVVCAVIGVMVGWLSFTIRMHK